MFKWIMIITVLSLNGEPPALVQGDSVSVFKSEKECLEHMSDSFLDFAWKAKTKNQEAQINHSSCYFIPALETPGETS